MTLDKKSLRKLEESSRAQLNDAQRRVLLERFGSEPEGHEWTEQDIWEQVRKLAW